MTRRDRIPKETTPYTAGEAGALLAPLLGVDPGDLRGILMIGIDKNGRGSIGGSSNLSDRTTLAILEALVASMRAAGVRT